MNKTIVKNPLQHINAFSDIKLMIAVPCGDMVHADFAQSLAALFGNALLNGIACGVNFTKGPLIDQNRNVCVNMARQEKMTHILFIDSDMAFKPEVLPLLLKRGKRIVGATYCGRKSPMFFLQHKNLQEDCEEIKELRMLKQQTGIYKVASLPGGMLLVAIDVFGEIEYPFVTDVRIGQGEDTYFCHEARTREESIWLDIDASRLIRHCGQHYYSIEDARPADHEGNYV